jgi:hypothetical protein
MVTSTLASESEACGAGVWNEGADSEAAGPGTDAVRSGSGVDSEESGLAVPAGSGRQAVSATARTMPETAIETAL